MCFIFYESDSLNSLKIAEQRIVTSGFNASRSIYACVCLGVGRIASRDPLVSPVALRRAAY